MPGDRQAPLRFVMRQDRENTGAVHSVAYGERRISFTLVYRRRKHMAIHVHPDQRIEVVAPEDRSLDEVLARVRKRALWIVKQLAYFERFQPSTPPRRYVSGETHRYLGRQYRLKIQAAREEHVKLIGPHFHVAVEDPGDPARVRSLLEAWYLDHARDLFSRRLDLCLQNGAPKVTRPDLTVRRMKTRWGSCSRNGRITLNTDLVKAPLDCIDYVITHELCHLKIREHTPAFYRLLTRCMPDWPRRKAKLESVTF